MFKKIQKIIALILCFSLIFEQATFAQVIGQLDISSKLASMGAALVQEKFRPLHLRYLAFDESNNNFNLHIDRGGNKLINASVLADTTKTLLSYFFIGLALPDSSFWVNLRPDAPDNIIDPLLAQTDVGKILLEADLQLKKDTALATSPQTPEGKQYWDRLYQKASELFGYENVTIPTLVRPWIVPGEIIVRESQNNAYVYKANLKVMLEDDYLKGSITYDFKDPRQKALNEYASELMRTLIIPKLTREVNNSRRYAPLRQLYYSLILAQWFKSKFKFRGKANSYARLIDQKNLTGLTSKQSWSTDIYFQQYQNSFKKGEYNLRETISTPYGQSIRTYFSGGIAMNASSPISEGKIVSLRATFIPADMPELNVSGNPLEGVQIRASETSSPVSSPVSEEVWLERMLGEETIANLKRINIYALNNFYSLIKKISLDNPEILEYLVGLLGYEGKERLEGNELNDFEEILRSLPRVKLDNLMRLVEILGKDNIGAIFRKNISHLRRFINFTTAADFEQKYRMAKELADYFKGPSSTAWDISKAKELLLLAEKQGLENLLNQPARDEELKKYALAVWLIIQDRIPFLTSDEFAVLFTKIIFMTRFNNTVFTDSDLHIGDKTHSIKTLFWGLAHELGHNIGELSQHRATPVTKHAGGLNEFLADIIAFNFYEAMGWSEREAINEIREELQYEDSQRLHSEGDWEEHVFARAQAEQIIALFFKEGQDKDFWNSIFRFSVEVLNSPELKQDHSQLGQTLIKKYQEGRLSGASSPVQDDSGGKGGLGLLKAVGAPFSLPYIRLARALLQAGLPYHKGYILKEVLKSREPKDLSQDLVILLTGLRQQRIHRLSTRTLQDFIEGFLRAFQANPPDPGFVEKNRELFYKLTVSGEVWEAGLNDFYRIFKIISQEAEQEAALREAADFLMQLRGHYDTTNESTLRNILYRVLKTPETMATIREFLKLDLVLNKPSLKEAGVNGILKAILEHHEKTNIALAEIFSVIEKLLFHLDSAKISGRFFHGDTFIEEFLKGTADVAALNRKYEAVLQVIEEFEKERQAVPDLPQEFKEELFLAALTAQNLPETFEKTFVFSKQFNSYFGGRYYTVAGLLKIARESNINIEETLDVLTRFNEALEKALDGSLARTVVGWLGHIFDQRRDPSDEDTDIYATLLVLRFLPLRVLPQQSKDRILLLIEKSIPKKIGEVNERFKSKKLTDIAADLLFSTRSPNSIDLGRLLFFMAELSPQLKLELAPIIILNSFREPGTSGEYPFLNMIHGRWKDCMLYKFIDSLTEEDIAQMGQREIAGLRETIEILKASPHLDQPAFRRAQKSLIEMLLSLGKGDDGMAVLALEYLSKNIPVLAGFLSSEELLKIHEFVFPALQTPSGVRLRLALEYFSKGMKFLLEEEALKIYTLIFPILQTTANPELKEAVFKIFESNIKETPGALQAILKVSRPSMVAYAGQIQNIIEALGMHNLVSWFIRAFLVDTLLDEAIEKSDGKIHLFLGSLLENPAFPAESKAILLENFAPEVIAKALGVNIKLARYIKDKRNNISEIMGRLKDPRFKEAINEIAYQLNREVTLHPVEKRPGEDEKASLFDLLFSLPDLERTKEIFDRFFSNDPDQYRINISQLTELLSYIEISEIKKIIDGIVENPKQSLQEIVDAVKTEIKKRHGQDQQNADFLIRKAEWILSNLFVLQEKVIQLERIAQALRAQGKTTRDLIDVLTAIDKANSFSKIYEVAQANNIPFAEALKFKLESSSQQAKEEILADAVLNLDSVTDELQKEQLLNDIVEQFGYQPPASQERIYLKLIFSLTTDNSLALRAISDIKSGREISSFRTSPLARTFLVRFKEIIIQNTALAQVLSEADALTDAAAKKEAYKQLRSLYQTRQPSYKKLEGQDLAAVRSGLSNLQKQIALPIPVTQIPHILFEPLLRINAHPETLVTLRQVIVAMNANKGMRDQLATLKNRLTEEMVFLSAYKESQANIILQQILTSLIAQHGPPSAENAQQFYDGLVYYLEQYLRALDTYSKTTQQAFPPSLNDKLGRLSRNILDGLIREGRINNGEIKELIEALSTLESESLLAQLKQKIALPNEKEIREKLQTYAATSSKFKRTDHQGRNIYQLISLYLKTIEDEEIYKNILDALLAEIDGRFAEWRHQSRDYQVTIGAIIEIEAEGLFKEGRLSTQEYETIQKMLRPTKPGKEGAGPTSLVEIIEPLESADYYSRLMALEGFTELKAKVRAVKEGWEQVQKVELEQGLTVEFNDDLYVLFNIGNSRFFSACQSCAYGSNLNRGLAGYVTNGTNKAVVLLDVEARVVTRRIIRLRIIIDGQGRKKPAIFVEESTQFNSQAIDELYGLLDRVSQKAGLPVVASQYRPATTSKVSSGHPTQYRIIEFQGRSQFGYSDLYGHSIPGHITAGLYRQSEAESTIGPFELLEKPIAKTEVNQLSELRNASSPVKDMLAAEIAKNNGRISFAQFMEIAQKEYYSRRVEIGRDKDFSTATEDPRFAAKVAFQLIQMWVIMGSPTEFTLVEMGAGTGSLAKNILKFLKAQATDPEQKVLYNALNYIIVERSELLKGQQKATLAEFGDKVSWKGLPELKKIKGVFLSNELVDDFSVHRVRKTEEGKFQEAYVVINDQGGFEDYWAEVSAEAQEYITNLPEDVWSQGKEIALNLEVGRWQEQIAAALDRGFVFTIDYGGLRDEIFSGQRTSVWSARQEGISIDDIYRAINEGELLNITALAPFEDIIAHGQRLGMPKVLFEELRYSGLYYKRPNEVADYQSISPAFKVLIQSKGVTVAKGTKLFAQGASSASSPVNIVQEFVRELKAIERAELESEFADWLIAEALAKALGLDDVINIAGKTDAGLFRKIIFDTSKESKEAHISQYRLIFEGSLEKIRKLVEAKDQIIQEAGVGSWGKLASSAFKEAFDRLEQLTGEKRSASSPAAQEMLDRLAKTIADRLRRSDYRNDIRGFLKKGKTQLWGQEISLEEFVRQAAKEAGMTIPNDINWEIFAEKVWQEARLAPQELVALAKRELEKQELLLRPVPTLNSKGLPEKTVKYADLPSAGYAELDSIDDARRIGESDGAIRLDLRAPSFRTSIQEYVEAPAQRLVEEILRTGGITHSSNAYGPGLKGVRWEKGGARYFTPLTIEDYNSANLGRESLRQTTSSPVSKDNKGGIDFRGLPINVEPMAATRNMANTPPANRIERFLDDVELREITNMINVGIMPSSERIREYAQSCLRRDNPDREIQKVLSCIADILKLQEECCQETEAGLRDLLVVVETKPIQEIPQALTAITTIVAKEPRLPR